MSCIPIFVLLATSWTEPAAIAEIPRSRFDTPAIAEMPFPPVSAEALSILLGWEKATAGLDRVEMEAREFVYDLAFDTETRRIVRGVLGSDGTFRLEWTPTPIPPGGRLQRLQPGEAERTERTRTELVLENRTRGTVQRIDLNTLPDLPRSLFDLESVIASIRADDVIPLATRVLADDVARRFEIEIVERNNDQIHLRLTPRNPSSSIRDLHVMLSAETLRPTAVKRIDASGNRETCYVFERVKAKTAN